MTTIELLYTIKEIDNPAFLFEFENRIASLDREGFRTMFLEYCYYYHDDPSYKSEAGQNLYKFLMENFKSKLKFLN